MGGRACSPRSPKISLMVILIVLWYRPPSDPNSHSPPSPAGEPTYPALPPREPPSKIHCPPMNRTNGNFEPPNLRCFRKQRSKRCVILIQMWVPRRKQSSHWFCYLRNGQTICVPTLHEHAGAFSCVYVSRLCRILKRFFPVVFVHNLCLCLIWANLVRNENTASCSFWMATQVGIQDFGLGEQERPKPKGSGVHC